MKNYGHISFVTQKQLANTCYPIPTPFNSGYGPWIPASEQEIEDFHFTGIVWTDHVFFGFKDGWIGTSICGSILFFSHDFTLEILKIWNGELRDSIINKGLLNVK